MVPQNVVDLPVLLTVDEVAEIFRVRCWAVRYWIRTGKIPSVKIGQRRLIARDVVRGLLDQAGLGEPPTPPEAA
jgi:excisionase family DNA binding protein